MIIASNGMRIVAPKVEVNAPPTIDVNDASATNYWAYRLKVTHEDLFSAISEVGPSVAAVRRHLAR